MSRAYFAVVLSQAMQISGDPTPTKPTTSCTEESPLVQELMAQAREKYVTQTELVPKIELLADTQKTMNFDERFDAALKKSNDLLSEAEAQLAAPCVAPTELTQEEEAELKREEDWNGLYKQADSFNDAWLRRNDQLLGDVTKLIDECDMERVTLPPDLCVAVPPPTPTLEQMDVPAPIASWIRASKRHLTQQPPNPSPAVDALRQIHSRSLSDQDFKSKSKAKSRIVAGSHSEKESLDVTRVVPGAQKQVLSARLRDGTLFDAFSRISHFDLGLIWEDRSFWFLLLLSLFLHWIMTAG